MTIEHSGNAHPLLDKLLADNGFRSDYQLSRFLGVAAPVISKIRTAYSNGGLYRGSPYRMTGDVMIAVHEKTGLSIADIKALASVPRVEVQ